MHNKSYTLLFVELENTLQLELTILILFKVLLSILQKIQNSSHLFPYIIHKKWMDKG
jgi:hypothetical protein